MITTTVHVRRRFLSLCLLIAPLAGCGGDPDLPADALDLDIDQLVGGGSAAGEQAANTTAISGDAVTGAASADSPIAHLSASPTAGFAPLTVRFSAAGSRAASGQLVAYAWDFGDGQTGEAVELFHTFAEAGVYPVRLTVCDALERCSSADIAVVVLPQIRILPTPAVAAGTVPLRMQFAVAIMGDAASVPADARYQWDFGDGTEGTGPNPMHVYKQPGKYTVSLALVIGALVLRGDQLSITVHAPGSAHNLPPVADAGPDQSVVDEDGDGVARVRLDGSRSLDPDGKIVCYRWEAVSGPQEGGLVVESAQPTTDVELGVGQHQFRLTVTDDQQASGQDEVSISVLTRAALTVTPQEGFSSHGQIGGSFLPEEKVYTLKNVGQQTLNWSGVSGQTWLSISPNAGVLSPGQSVQVTVSIQTAPATLGVGVHRDTLTFTNRTNSVGTATRDVLLTVTDLASPVISGRVTEDGVGLPDVVMEGLPGDPTTDGQGYYHVSVPHGWSGLVLPTKVDYTFDPPSRRYSNVTADAPDQDYVATAVEPQYADHVSQYGITWTFDRPYRVGQFVNGDWWVCPDTPEGTVVVVTIDPVPGVRNGSELNPIPGKYQGFDARLYDYDPSLTVRTPLAIIPCDRLVSAISTNEDNPWGEPGLMEPAGARTYLRTAAVLTCVPSPIGPDAFRPPYTWDVSAYGPPPIYRIGQLPALAELPQLAAPNPSDIPDPARHARYFERLWLDHKYAWSGREMHPAQNMPNYGREIARASGTALLLVSLHNVASDQRQLLLIRLVQTGLDLYGIAKWNRSPQAPYFHKRIWLHGGGHGLGRKVLIQFAGKMLDDPQIYGMNDYLNSEDSNCYFGHYQNPPVTSWTNWHTSGHPFAQNVLWGMWKDREHPADMANHHEVHPQYWKDPPFPVQNHWPFGKLEGYNILCARAYPAQALAALIFDLRENWQYSNPLSSTQGIGGPAFFAYVDRWMYEDYFAVQEEMAYWAWQHDWDELEPLALVHAGTARAGSASTITLSVDASATNNAYNAAHRIKITGGTGAGQRRRIVAYTGAARVLEVDLPWDVVPDNTSQYEIRYTYSNPVLRITVESQKCYEEHWSSHFVFDMWHMYRSRFE